jgi:flagellar hook protein FlgE
MYSGVSGLSAQSQALSMISDNISNLKTVGDKGTAARFQTLVTNSTSATSYASGGVRSTAAQRIDQQGLPQNSASGTDLSIMGNGFFVVSNTANAGIDKGFFFTRAGGFTTDATGRMMTTSGQFLQGWPIDANGNLPANSSLLSGLQTVAIPQTTAAAVPSSNISLGINVPAEAAVGDSFQTTVQLFDKQGSTQNFDIIWTKTAANAWDLTGTLEGTGNFASTDTAAATFDNGQATPVSLGSVTFNADGTLQAVTAGAYGSVDADGHLNFYVDYDGSAATTATADRQQVTLDLGIAGGGDGITQYSGEFRPSRIDQNGRSIGAFSGIAITSDGVVTALFDNGQQRNLYKLPLATFRNANGLEAQSGISFKATQRSGDPILAQANSGGAGVISPNSLESSTVDLAEEFTNMIITQRAYSANAKVITTADAMLSELLQISR